MQALIPSPIDRCVFPVPESCKPQTEGGKEQDIPYRFTFGYKHKDNIKIYVKELLNAAIERKKQTLPRNSPEFKQWRNDIVKNLQDRYVRLVMAVSQNKIKLPKKVDHIISYFLVSPDMHKIHHHPCVIEPFTADIPSHLPVVFMYRLLRTVR